MSISERGEIMTAIYKLRADAGVIYARCQEARALQIGVSIGAVQTILNEALADVTPPGTQYEMPPVMNRK
jgi:hypothetical protein